jgi:hypothetical protein
LITIIPHIKIYYSSEKKNLPLDPEIGFKTEDVNTAFTGLTDIIIWRSEELLKCIIHELMHFYKLEFPYYLYPYKHKQEIYNTYRIDSSKSVRPNEAYCEVFANIFNIVIVLVNKSFDITETEFAEAYAEELRFSIQQVSRIFKYLKYNSSKDFYIKTNSQNGVNLKQDNTDVLSYHYLKLKLLLWFDQLLEIINPNFNNLPTLYIQYSTEITNFYDKFQKLLVNYEQQPQLDKILTVEMYTLYQSDRNLKMTSIEDTIN